MSKTDHALKPSIALQGPFDRGVAHHKTFSVTTGICTQSAIQIILTNIKIPGNPWSQIKIGPSEEYALPRLWELGGSSTRPFGRVMKRKVQKN